ncbi:MAG: hypothetical protein OEY56_13695 [Cyclobacteriaceae bacterium]|nr:hypothetical protein [Cyclobacteriaceae bacterium]
MLSQVFPRRALRWSATCGEQITPPFGWLSPTGKGHQPAVGENTHCGIGLKSSRITTSIYPAEHVEEQDKLVVAGLFTVSFGTFLEIKQPLAS